MTNENTTPAAPLSFPPDKKLQHGGLYCAVVLFDDETWQRLYFYVPAGRTPKEVEGKLQKWAGPSAVEIHDFDMALDPDGDPPEDAHAKLYRMPPSHKFGE